MRRLDLDSGGNPVPFLRQAGATEYDEPVIGGVHNLVQIEAPRRRVDAREEVQWLHPLRGRLRPVVGDKALHPFPFAAIEYGKPRLQLPTDRRVGKPDGSQSRRWAFALFGTPRGNQKNEKGEKWD